MKVTDKQQSDVGGKSTRYLALLEQLFISGSNFILYVYAARVLSKDAWGSLSFVLAFLLVLQGLQRAFVIIPMTTSGDKYSVDSSNLHFWRRTQAWITGITLLLLFCIYIFGSSYLETWVAQSIGLAAILLVPLYYMEFARRLVVMTSSMYRLVAMAIIYAVIILICAATIHLMNGEPAILSFVMIIAIAAIASSLSCGIPLYPVPGKHDGGSWNITSLWQFGRWATASTLAYVGYTFTIQAILAAISGPAALGIFSATRNLAQPVNTLIQAIDNIDKPRAGRVYAEKGIHGLWGAIRSSWKWLLLLAIPYLLLLGIFSEHLLVIIYGEKYADEVAAVQLWIVVMFVMIFVQPLETALYVIRRPDWLFYGRMFSVALVLMLTPWLIKHWSVQGALGAQATGWGLAGISAMWLLIRLAHREKEAQ